MLSVSSNTRAVTILDGPPHYQKGVLSVLVWMCACVNVYMHVCVCVCECVHVCGCVLM